MIIRRILGLIIILTAISLLAVSVAGAYFVGDALENLANGIAQTLEVAANSLETARGTLDLARNSVSEMDGGLQTAIDATASAAQTLSDSRPLLDNVANVTTQEVPEAIEGMQTALPGLIEVASVIDNTLSTLSTVGIDRDIPLPFGGSIPLRFDLGIDYNPDAAFDDSLRVFEQSLTGLPESLRGLEDDLATTSGNLGLLSANLVTTSDNLAAMNSRFSDLVPLLDQYSLLIDEVSALTTQAQTQIGDRLELIKWGAIGLLVAVGLSQLAPLYLGWELLTGRRDSRPAGGQAEYPPPDTAAVAPAPPYEPPPPPAPPPAGAPVPPSNPEDYA